VLLCALTALGPGNCQIVCATVQCVAINSELHLAAQGAHIVTVLMQTLPVSDKAVKRSVAALCNQKAFVLSTCKQVAQVACSRHSVQSPGGAPQTHSAFVCCAPPRVELPSDCNGLSVDCNLLAGTQCKGRRGGWG
jgi:hypothetical protein